MHGCKAIGSGREERSQREKPYKTEEGFASAGKGEKPWGRHNYHRSGLTGRLRSCWRTRLGRGGGASGAQDRVRACAAGGLGASRPRSWPSEVPRPVSGPHSGDDRNTPPRGCSPPHGRRLLPPRLRPHPEQGRGPPYLAAWRARCPSSAARTWTRSPGSTPRPRPGRATRRRGSGCAPPPRPPPLQPLQSPFRRLPPSAPARSPAGPGGGGRLRGPEPLGCGGPGFCRGGVEPGLREGVRGGRRGRSALGEAAAARSGVRWQVGGRKGRAAGLAVQIQGPQLSLLLR